MNEQQIQEIVAQVLAGMPQVADDRGRSSLQNASIPIEASARHVHLSEEAFRALFGPGELTQTRALSQPGEFLAAQRVSVVTPKGMLENIAVLGPLRKAVQVELSLTDCRKLGLNAPLRLSGNLQGAADTALVGPAGVYEARGSVIVAQNHVHMTPGDAKKYSVRDGDMIALRAQTARPVTFEQVAVRVSENFALAMHIDFDEANACMLDNGSVGAVVNAECRNENAEILAIEDKVITEARAKELCKTGQITLRRGTLITPSAKDVFHAANCEVKFV